MENAVIYARYSSHNQTENSIEAQVEAAMSFAKSNKYNVIKTYADRAKTGTNDNRDAFQQMLSDTEHKNFSVIIVWKVDRFGRNREEIALNKYRCKKNGVRVEYVAENISPGPEGVILESILEGFAEYYSKQLSQNTRRGIANIAKKGKYTGGKPPYGYKIVEGKYVINPEEAKKIKEVFKLFASGLNFSQIAEKLDLSYYNIRIYLSNKSYYDGVYRRCGVNLPNIIPPIIDEKTFLSVQERLHSYTKRRAPKDYPLTGKIFCKKCGSKYTGYSGTYKGWKYAYYRSTCKCAGCLKCIRQKELEEDITNKAMEILTSDENLDNLVNKVYEKLKVKFKEVNPAKKESLIAKKQRLLRLVEDGALPYEDLRERLVQIDAELMKFSVGASSPTINRDQIRNYVTNIKDGILKRDIPLLSSTFINKIEVELDGTYTVKFGPSHFGTN